MISLFRFCFLSTLLFSLASGISVNADEKDIVLKLSADKQPPTQHPFSGEWLESPWGELFQFRAGDQSWLTAREHCLSLNSDLATIRDSSQLDWILSHYAPISSRFAKRLIQIGLYAAEGTTHQWKWLDGSDVNTTLSWASGEPYDHSMEGRERCGLLNIDKRQLDDVDCEATSSDHHALRYICQRSSEIHKKQQNSNNYIWGKIEQLFGFFGIGGSTAASTNTTRDYEDEVEQADKKGLTSFTDDEGSGDDSSEESSSEEEASVIKTLAALPKIEGSGETTKLRELKEEEGSGQIVDKKAIEEQVTQILDEKKLDNMISKMEEMIKSLDDLTASPNDQELERTTVATLDEKELSDNTISQDIEGDFDKNSTKDMPVADIKPSDEEEEDCEDASGSGSGESEGSAQPEVDSQTIQLSKEKEEHVKEFLGVLRLFLDRAEHGDLKKLLDDKSGTTLLERMKHAIHEANKKEFEQLEQIENAKSNGSSVESRKTQMSPVEQREIYKKISSAVMRAAKEESDMEKEQEEKFDIAKKTIEDLGENDQQLKGKIEVLKSAKESHPVEKVDKVDNDDYYGDYLEDNDVIKVHNGQKKKKAASDEEEDTGAETFHDSEVVEKNLVETSHREPKKEKEDSAEKREEAEKKEESAEKPAESEKKEEGAEKPDEPEKEESAEKSEEEEKKEESTEKPEEVEKEKKDSAEKPDEPEKGESAEKPDEPEKGESAEKPEEAKKKGENTEKSEEAEKKEESAEKPEEVEKEKKDSTEKRDEPEKEDSTEKPEEVKKEESTEKPEEAEKKEESAEKPEDAEKEKKSTEKPEKKEEITAESKKADNKTKKNEKLSNKPKKDEKKKVEIPESEGFENDEESSGESSGDQQDGSGTSTESHEDLTTIKSTTKAPTTAKKPSTVGVRQLTKEDLEELSKFEAAEKVTLFPPLPTFGTLPTLAPFKFPTIAPATTPKPVKGPKIPTLEEILNNLNNQFKKLLTPPKS